MPSNKPVTPLEWAAASGLCCVRVCRKTVACYRLPSAPGPRLCGSQSPPHVSLERLLGQISLSRRQSAQPASGFLEALLHPQLSRIPSSPAVVSAFLNFHSCLLSCFTATLWPSGGRSPGEGNGNPLRYSGLEKPVDRGAWRATVHGVANRRTRLKQPGTCVAKPSRRAWRALTGHLYQCHCLNWAFPNVSTPHSKGYTIY